jgi:hypothetical protein
MYSLHKLTKTKIDSYTTSISVEKYTTSISVEKYVNIISKFGKSQYQKFL